ncbi:MAG: glycine--tRNA ligase [Verrucomicrobiota bacterium]|nr:glycine--tRNA ligase [Verrucomicrobiota bacterium]
MDAIVSLCKRRGFTFQSSEIYGGLRGLWDYGPLGVELKRNIKEVWWRDMITTHDELAQPEGTPSTFQMVGIESSIIMHPRVWKTSGHYDLFADQMVDCRESKKRYRYDHVKGRWVSHEGNKVFITTAGDADDLQAALSARALQYFGLKAKYADKLEWEGEIADLPTVKDHSQVVGPDTKELGTLTEPRDFNLMFETYVGALRDEENKAFLRPETAQGMFVNFKNVMDSNRVKIPFGIAQQGKSFRNEITPRNFTFRTREFEQMEMEFFCHPDESPKWYTYWRDRRFKWYTDLGIDPAKLILRDHDADELSHYSVGTADVEYAFPFCEEGEFGELEGIAHRGDFDLRSHMEGKLVREGDKLVVEKGEDGKPKYPGSGKDMTILNEETKERYVPHVIEPAAGADRTVLAFICNAYNEETVTNDKGKEETRVVMKFHPRIAPYKVGVFPLLKNKPELVAKAREVCTLLRPHMAVFYDEGGAIGRRYRRQDEAGTPYGVTIDFDTLGEQGDELKDTITLRDRDTMEQTRMPIGELLAFLLEKIR